MTSPYYNERGVLTNKLGIDDATELKAAEYSLTSRRLAELEAGRTVIATPGFGLDRLKAIHEHIFQDVYAWAGQERTVPSSKRAENGMVSVFETPAGIGSSWEALGQEAQKFANAKGLGIEQQREQLASIYIEANRIHSFPEGNGRSLQTFMKQLAREQGLDLDFTRTNAKDWNLASALSGTHGRLFEGHYLVKQPSDPQPITKIFGDIVRPARAMAFEHLPPDQACAKFPELHTAYVGLQAIEERATKNLGGDAQRVAGYMQEVRASFVQRLDQGKMPEQKKEAWQNQERRTIVEQDR